MGVRHFRLTRVRRCDRRYNATMIVLPLFIVVGLCCTCTMICLLCIRDPCSVLAWNKDTDPV